MGTTSFVRWTNQGWGLPAIVGQRFESIDPCHSRLAQRSAHMKSKPPSAPGAWARSTRPPTPASTAPSLP